MEIYNPQCSQCGFHHPPLKEGTKCPAAKEKTESGEEIDLTNFHKNLTNVLHSQIKSKKIKNVKRILAFTLINITKLLERYKE
jgi:hypothetical protein